MLGTAAVFWDDERVMCVGNGWVRSTIEVPDSLCIIVECKASGQERRQGKADRKAANYWFSERTHLCCKTLRHRSILPAVAAPAVTVGYTCRRDPEAARQREDYGRRSQKEYCRSSISGSLTAWLKKWSVLRNTFHWVREEACSFREAAILSHKTRQISYGVE